MDDKSLNPYRGYADPVGDDTDDYEDDGHDGPDLGGEAGTARVGAILSEGCYCPCCSFDLRAHSTGSCKRETCAMCQAEHEAVTVRALATPAPATASASETPEASDGGDGGNWDDNTRYTIASILPLDVHPDFIVERFDHDDRTSPPHKLRRLWRRLLRAIGVGAFVCFATWM